MFHMSRLRRVRLCVCMAACVCSHVACGYDAALAAQHLFVVAGLFAAAGRDGDGSGAGAASAAPPHPGAALPGRHGVCRPAGKCMHFSPPNFAPGRDEKGRWLINSWNGKSLQLLGRRDDQSQMERPFFAVERAEEERPVMRMMPHDAHAAMHAEMPRSFEAGQQHPPMPPPPVCLLFVAGVLMMLAATCCCCATAGRRTRNAYVSPHLTSLYPKSTPPTPPRCIDGVLLKDCSVLVASVREISPPVIHCRVRTVRHTCTQDSSHDFAIAIRPQPLHPSLWCGECGATRQVLSSVGGGADCVFCFAFQ